MNFFLISIIMAAMAAAYSTSANLVRIDDSNFRELVIDSGKYVFVDFYADWCRHCKNLMPTIEQLADLFEAHDNVEVYKINGDKDGKRMAKKYVFEGYPTMKLFHGTDEPIEFDGSRDLESLSNFVQQASGIRLARGDSKAEQTQQNRPASVGLALDDDNFAEKVLGVNRKSVVVFTASWCHFCEELEPRMEMLQEAFQNDNETVQFGTVVLDQVPSDKISDQFGVKRLPSILFFDPLAPVPEDGVRRPVIYPGKKEVDDMLAYINEFAGLHRDLEGGLGPMAGRIPEVDAAIEQLLQQPDRSIAGLEFIGDFEMLTVQHPQPMSPYYKKLLNKVIVGEDHYFQKEIDRLETILEHDVDKLQPRTIDSMRMRANVLKVFAQK